MPSTTQPGTVVEVRNLVKSYGAIRALRGVSASFLPGEIHGLLGANGAGKSTLVRMLAGLEQPDDGRIVIDGEPQVIHDSFDAGRKGFAFIHQELNLIPNFTAAQNIMLGQHSGSPLALRRFTGVPEEVAAAAHRIGIDFDLRTSVGALSVHRQWLVTIARALVADSRLIAMDEPTASLDAEEASRLMAVAKDLATDGVAILFISHRLEEVMELCDRATVFRDGRVVSTMQRTDMTKGNLIAAIVGRAGTEPADHNGRSSSRRTGKSVLAVRGIRRGKMIRGADLDLREGELLGLAGLVGSGRTELARVIFGADRPDSGAMTLHDRPYRPRSIADAIKQGIAYVPEERRAEALFLDQSVECNVHAASWKALVGRFLPLVSMRRSSRLAESTTKELGVVLRAGGIKQGVGQLSGGNQQKVVLGRWLETEPRILLLDEPTRGVDIGARTDIYKRIREIAQTGLTVLVISSEFEELLECDRVAVMSRGQVVGELEGEAISVNRMLELCYT
jgi:ribose transport system ATP-binding protein